MASKDVGELLSVAQIQEEFGLDRPQTVHQYCKKYEVPKERVKNRVYIRRGDFDAAMKKKAAGSPGKPAKGKKKVPKVKVDGKHGHGEYHPQPFRQDPKVLLWDRGRYRGWCFACIDEIDPEVVDVLTSYKQRHTWSSESLATGVATGNFFIAEPAEALRFLAMQFAHTKDSALREQIKPLEEIAKRLDDIEAEYKEAKGG